jgi:alpha-beta hydrolase superfamily lysophospholipase
MIHLLAGAVGAGLLIVCAGCTIAISPEETVGESTAAIKSSRDPADSQVIRLDHQLSVAPDVSLHVVEKYSPAALGRHHPRRAIVMLTGTLVTSTMYDTDVPDHPEYNALDRMARAGFFAYSVDYEGYGASSHPVDGRIVNKERLLAQVGTVVEWVRWHRWIPRVDLMGASLGTDLAFKLGAVGSPINRHHIGKVILTASVYKSVTPLFQQVFFNPELQAILEGFPYIQTGPEQYGLILNAAEAPAAAWAYEAFPGIYATGPTLEGFRLPAYRAQDGRAKALLFWGDQELISPYEDAALFAAEYGGPIELVRLAGGSHAPFYEPAKEQFWSKVFEFLKPSCGRPADEVTAEEVVLSDIPADDPLAAATATTETSPSGTAFADTSSRNPRTPVKVPERAHAW